VNFFSTPIIECSALAQLGQKVVVFVRAALGA
jgi:hypothetical protein